jgi:hypothetical protein
MSTGAITLDAVAERTGMLAVGIAAGWWVHRPPSKPACADQADGARLCWMYTRLPAPTPPRPAQH